MRQGDQRSIARWPALEPDPRAYSEAYQKASVTLSLLDWKSKRGSTRDVIREEACTRTLHREKVGFHTHLASRVMLEAPQKTLHHATCASKIAGMLALGAVKSPSRAATTASGACHSVPKKNARYNHVQCRASQSIKHMIWRHSKEMPREKHTWGTTSGSLDAAIEAAN